MMFVPPRGVVLLETERTGKIGHVTFVLALSVRSGRALIAG